MGALTQIYIKRLQVVSWLQVLAWTAAVQGSLLDPLYDENEHYTMPAQVILKDCDTFDFIVVGAGAGGSVVAARLALDGHRVLLVEAGGDPSPSSKVPAAAMGLLGSNIDWQYETIPNNVSCLASRGRQCRFSRGKCLGGSTSINYMLYTRGNRRDYDEYNIPGWTWRDLEPYFLRYEGLQVLDQFPPSSIPYHNSTGILNIEYFADPENPWRSRLLKGYQALGFPKNIDVNGASQIGVTRNVGYVRNGERMSAAYAYLARKDVQRTLKVAKNTLCTGVIIDDDNVTRGVTVLARSAPTPLRLFARNEVILSAGAIGTPQILMLSGIGHMKHLRQMGITPRVDLSVGDDMSDHVLPLIVLTVDHGIQIAKDVFNVLDTVTNLAEYLVLHGGPLGSNGLTEVNAFANMLCYNGKSRRLRNNCSDCQLPSVQIIHAYIAKNLLALAKPLFQQAIGLNDNAIDQLVKANVNSALIIVSPIILSPFSLGSVRLASSDPSDMPAILANYLSDRRDVDQMLQAIEIIEDLVQTPPLKENNARILKLRFPGCPRYKSSRRGYWRCYVRHMTYAVFHAVGTTALGRVVDERLRVRGVRGLRVADAGVLPWVPRGNTEAPTVAIGERAVDFIRETLHGCIGSSEQGSSKYCVSHNK